MKFDLPKDNSSIIKVIGVGGGGSNAVNHMFRQGIKGVDFIVCNTDQQALDISPVPIKIQLGASLTEGRGAGSIPEVGKNAAIENLDEIKEILESNTKMVFVTAGMGGGTGTGAAPIIAKVAKDLGILTVGIVTVPFGFEGRKRKTQAENGLEGMRDAVDTLLIINNDKLREMFGNLTLANAFSQADEVLATAAKGIAEVISVTGAINVDFNDVSTVMKDSGVAIMGSAEAEGEDRALKCVEKALTSPLLNDNQILGAKYVLLNITYGATEVLMDEIADITDYIQDEAGSTADVIWGHGFDETLGEKLSVTIIATGFEAHEVDAGMPVKTPEKKVVSLEADRPTMITQPIQKPIASPVENAIKPMAFSAEEPRTEEEPFLVKKREDAVPSVSNVPTSDNANVVEDVTKPDTPKEDVSVVETKLNTYTSDVAETPMVNELPKSEFSLPELNKEDASQSEVMGSVVNEEVAGINDDITSSTVDEVVEEVTSTTTEWSFVPTQSEAVEEVENNNIETQISAETPVQEVHKTWLEEEQKVEEPNISFAKEEAPVSNASNDGKVRYMLTDDTEDDVAETSGFNANVNEAPVKETPTIEDNAELAKMRLERIRQAGTKMNTQEGLAELEQEPAYLRRKIRLDDVQHSSESSISRFTLGDAKNEEGENKSGLSDNNSFLHDNVD